MHIVHEQQNLTTSQIQSVYYIVQLILLCLIFFTTRLGEGLGSWNVSVSSRSRPERSRAHPWYRPTIVLDIVFCTRSISFDNLVVKPGHQTGHEYSSTERIGNKLEYQLIIN